MFDCNGRHIFTTSETGLRRSSASVSISSSLSSLTGSRIGGNGSVAGIKPKRRKLKNPHGLTVDLKGGYRYNLCYYISSLFSNCE